MSTDNVVHLRVYTTPQEAAAQAQQVRRAQQLADAVLLFEELVITRAQAGWLKTPRQELEQLADMARQFKRGAS